MSISVSTFSELSEWIAFFSRFGNLVFEINHESLVTLKRLLAVEFILVKWFYQKKNEIIWLQNSTILSVLIRLCKRTRKLPDGSGLNQWLC